MNIPDHWEQNIIKLSQVKMHYYRTGGTKPPLLLLHGFSDNGLCWTRLAKDLEENYDIIFLDMEAGLEHFSRRTDRDVDELIIVTDMSRMGFNTMDRIVEISKEVHLKFSKYWIIGNRFNEEAKSILEQRVSQLKDSYKIDIEVIGYVPQNTDITMRNLNGEAIIDLPEDNPAYVEAEKWEKEFSNTN